MYSQLTVMEEVIKLYLEKAGQLTYKEISQLSQTQWWGNINQKLYVQIAKDNRLLLTHLSQ